MVPDLVMLYYTVVEAPRFKDVRHVFTNRCAQCHTASTPLDFSKYEVAKANAQRILFRVVVERSMPPVRTDMTEDERRLIKAWIEQGAQP